MKKQAVYRLDGTTLSLQYLDRVRKYMEEAAADNYNFEYKSTEVSNVEYVAEKDHYKFTLEFFK